MDEYDSFADENIIMNFHPLMDLKRENITKEKVLHRKNIKLLSYNIFLRPPPVKNNESDWKDARVLEFSKIISEFDIILLQEMFAGFNNRKQQLIKFANLSGLFYFVDSPSPSFFSKSLVDGGLLILSRFPISEYQFYPFRYSVLSDSLAQKGILYSKIKVRDTYLIILNIHLQASYMNSTQKLAEFSKNTRQDQIIEMCHFIKKLVEENKITRKCTVVLAGDFNVDAQEVLEMKVVKTDIENSNGNKKSLEDEESEYGFLQRKLNENGIAIDIFKKFYDYNPFTFGFNGDHLKKFDQVLTDKDDVGSFMSLDYIFELFIDKNDYDRRNINKKLSPIYDTSQIEHFLVDEKPYQQMSDHFGLSVEIKYNNSNDLQSNNSNLSNRSNIS